MAAENFNQAEALKRLGQRYDEEGNPIGTAEAPLGTAGNAAGAVAGAAVETAANGGGNAAGMVAAQGAAGTVAGAGKSAAEKAIEQQGERVAAEIKAKQAQAQWEPTKENLMRSGLNAADYIRKAREAGAKIDPLDVYMGFYAKDPTKTWAENEADEKKAKAQANMAAIGNALMHVGNFVGGMVGGQSVKLEDPVQFTQRQKALKERTDALRLAAWQNSYNTYKDKLAAERAQAAAELAAKRQAQQENYQNTLAAIAAGKAAADAKAKEKAGEQRDRALDQKEEAHKETVRHHQETETIGKTNAAANYTRAEKSGSGGSGSRGGSGKGKWLGADGKMYPNIQSAVATFPDGYKPKGDVATGEVRSGALNEAYDRYHREVTHKKTNNGGGSAGKSKGGGQKPSAVSKLGIRKKK